MHQQLHAGPFFSSDFVGFSLNFYFKQSRQLKSQGLKCSCDSSAGGGSVRGAERPPASQLGATALRVTDTAKNTAKCKAPSILCCTFLK